MCRLLTFLIVIVQDKWYNGGTGINRKDTVQGGYDFSVAEKYYAVKRGLKTGIFRTWAECRANVTGYSGAIYKSFGSMQEALAFLDEKPAEGKGLKIYVDGSYHAATNEFSYGMVVLNGEEEEQYSRKFQDAELASMRNVAGEIKGAEAAMQYALDKGIKEISIYHDYEGIARWCLGEWKTNKEGTKAYKNFYDQACEKVKIHFVKVAGHSNDKYNDMADMLAKEALGICEAAGE